MFSSSPKIGSSKECDEHDNSSLKSSEKQTRHLKKILRPTRPTCCLRVVCVALTTRCAIAPVWRQTVVWYGTPISDVINLGICRSSLRITDGCCYLFLWAPGQESRVNIILYFNNRAIKKFGTELLCYICFLSLILIKFSENYAQQWCSPLKTSISTNAGNYHCLFPLLVFGHAFHAEMAWQIYPCKHSISTTEYQGIEDTPKIEWL